MRTQSPPKGDEPLMWRSLGPVNSLSRSPRCRNRPSGHVDAEDVVRCETEARTVEEERRRVCAGGCRSELGRVDDEDILVRTAQTGNGEDVRGRQEEPF